MEPIHPSIARNLQEVLGRHYPGGIHNFADEGGDIIYTPTSIIISKPEIDEKTLKIIKREFPTTKFTYITGRQDISVADAIAIQKRVTEHLSTIIQDSVDGYITLTPKSCFLMLEATAQFDNQLVEEIKKVVDDLPKVGRVLFFQPHSDVQIWEKAVIKVESQKPVRQFAITKDDEANLKISLSKEVDVLDFLKSLEGG